MQPYHFHSHPPSARVSISLYPQDSFYLYIFYNSSPDRCKALAHCGLDLHNNFRVPLKASLRGTPQTMLICNKEMYAPNRKTETFHIHRMIIHLASTLGFSQKLPEITNADVKNPVMKRTLFAVRISKATHGTSTFNRGHGTLASRWGRMQVGHHAVCGGLPLWTRVPLNAITEWPRRSRQAGRRPRHASFPITPGQGAENICIARLCSSLNRVRISCPWSSV